LTDSEGNHGTSVNHHRNKGALVAQHGNSLQHVLGFDISHIFLFDQEQMGWVFEVYIQLHVG
jgi:hypothetical protein